MTNVGHKENLKKMKVLLINPITSERKLTIQTPNLGLGYIVTSLRRNGFEADILDGPKKGMTRKKITERLKIFDYDVAAFQVYSCSVKETHEYLKMIKSLNPKVITIIGGAHPSGVPEEAMTYLNPDFAFGGEAEEGLPKLLKKLNGNNVEYKFEGIPNLIWRKNGEIICNPRQPIKDLDSLGLPSWDLINPNDYPRAPLGGFVKNFPIATLSCTRGCPYECTYCGNLSIMGRRLRCRSKESVLSEMQLLYNDYGVREFQIIDDNFTVKKSLVVGICKGIIEKGLKISMSLPNGVRMETLDEELLRLLERAGCYSFAVGIESGSQKILHDMKRWYSLSELEEKIKLVKRVTKIRVSGFFIIGYPTEKKEDVIKTIKFAKRLPLSRGQFIVFLPLPGSEIYRKLKDEGKLKHLDFDDIIAHHITPINENLTMKQLKRLRLQAFLEFYLRPRIIWGLLSEIKSWEQVTYITKRILLLFTYRGFKKS